MMVPLSGAIYPDLLPWELIFYISLALIVLTLLSLVFRALRRGPRKAPRLRILILLICVPLAILPFVIFPDFPARLAAGLERNSAETSATPEFAELRTRRYEQSQDVVFDAAITAVRQQRGWRLLSSDRERGQITVAVSVPALGGIFTDDLTITISEEAGQTRVDARSQARVGTGDLGENRRHIAQFFHALDQQLGR